MTTNDRHGFAGVMHALGEAFNEPVSDTRADLYFEALEDLSLAALQSAARAYIRSSTFFPKAAELRAAVLGTVDDRAELAWQAVLREVRRVGWTGSPTFDRATSRAAYGLFGGGWRALCENLPAAGPELLGYRKQFLAAYGAIERQAETARELPPTRAEARAALLDVKAALKQRGLPTGRL